MGGSRPPWPNDAGPWRSRRCSSSFLCKSPSAGGRTGFSGWSDSCRRHTRSLVAEHTAERVGLPAQSVCTCYRNASWVEEGGRGRVGLCREDSRGQGGAASTVSETPLSQLKRLKMPNRVTQKHADEASSAGLDRARRGQRAGGLTGRVVGTHTGQAGHTMTEWGLSKNKSGSSTRLHQCHTPSQWAREQAHVTISTGLVIKALTAQLPFVIKHPKSRNTRGRPQLHHGDPQRARS